MSDRLLSPSTPALLRAAEWVLACLFEIGEHRVRLVMPHSQRASR